MTISKNFIQFKKEQKRALAQIMEKMEDSHFNDDYMRRVDKGIQIVSAVCGSGKSYTLTKQIIEKKMDRNHLIVLQTLKLIEQYYENFLAVE
jgi:phage terminase large subunit